MVRTLLKASVVGIAICLATISRAAADDEDATALDARLAKLQSENAALRKRAEIEKLEGENSALRRQLGFSDNSSRHPPRISGAVATPAASAYASSKAPEYSKAPMVPLVPKWEGLFVGGSFGGTVTRSQLSVQEVYTSSFPTNSPPFNVSGLTTQSNAGASGHIGATLDGFVGANSVFGRLLAGIQLEGTVSNISFDGSGGRLYSYFNAAGLTGQTATGSFNPHTYARWMVSALVRAGAVLDPQTLLYVIGGWTAGQFEVHDLTNNTFFEPPETCWANGLSVGAGIERKLDESWSIRGEYRYTRFATAVVDGNFTFVSNFPSSQTDSIHAAFKNEMQTVRLGVSHQILPSW
jgi:opacity protein-like surface antigen